VPLLPFAADSAVTLNDETVNVAVDVVGVGVVGVEDDEPPQADNIAIATETDSNLLI
jgi:phosphatidate phosphatase APP1